MYSAPRVNLMNDEALIHCFIQLISQNTGLHIREEDKNTLTKKIWQRIKSLRISNPEDYYLFLEANNESKTLQGKLGHWSAKQEWKELVCLLTTGESYFFRDQGQFSLLRTKIFPEIIATKLQNSEITGNQKKSLRIWSAGCSTGEEPYSLAILIKELISNLENWNIVVLGTDINYQAIEKAKQGIYNPWSFRLVDPHLQIDYFQQQQNEWQIDTEIRQMVKLQQGNLLTDNFPDHNTEIHDMDLILCRNVFVYFEHQAITTVVKKFYDSLVPGGYLMTAHTELYGQNMGKFQVNVLPESVIYQRRQSKQLESGDSVQSEVKKIDLYKGCHSDHSKIFKSEIAKYPDKPAVMKELPHQTKSFNCDRYYATSPIAKPTAEPVTKNVSTSINQNSSINLMKEAEMLFQEEAYVQAINKAEQVIACHAKHFAAHYLLAQAYANLGQHNQAVYYCQKAIAIDSLAVQPYHLLAHIAEEKQDLEKAKIFLKTIIYLSPSFVSPYLELASIYEKEGNSNRAKKMLATALELLNQLPSSAIVEQQSSVTVGELLEYVKKLL
ncbi:CheR family methyltransferase [[Phormidium] sp. LEGE 05292]|uniref:CheR family methyltransferase n=1 Tax=[Phormidium] sp. LEGE 05292 TaxID=767427 RepID=UPI001D1561F9|nr:CheR family methyltransferase [Phormidium sp. LEGE 05292]